MTAISGTGDTREKIVGIVSRIFPQRKYAFVVPSDRTHREGSFLLLSTVGVSVWIGVGDRLVFDEVRDTACQSRAYKTARKWRVVEVHEHQPKTNLHGRIVRVTEDRRGAEIAFIQPDGNDREEVLVPPWLWKGRNLSVDSRVSYIQLVTLDGKQALAMSEIPTVSQGVYWQRRRGTLCAPQSRQLRC